MSSSLNGCSGASWDWSSREMAEFYRVESALIQAGLKIESDRGVSDEGDPWFAFCRPDDSEVIVHIARIGGIYILAGPSYDGIASGSDIGALVRDLVTRHPLIQMRGNNAGQASKIFLHPAALLIAVVATAFFKSTEARALTDEHKSAGDSRGGGVAARPDNGSALEIYKTVVMDAAQTAVILSAVAAALQIPSPLATEYDTPNAVASTSDLLDFAVLSPSSQSQHALSSLSGPAALEVHQFELVQDVHAQPNSIVLPAPLAHVETRGSTATDCRVVGFAHESLRHKDDNEFWQRSCCSDGNQSGLGSGSIPDSHFQDGIV